jgi:acetyl esterase/lipase
MKTRLASLLCVVALSVSAHAADGPPSVVMDLWPGVPPGETGPIAPEKEKDTGASVIICPGGGYYILAFDHEGEQVARWLNGIGVTGVVLKYRVPRRKGTPNDQPPPQALMDAQRAVSLVRSKAAEWGLDPKRVGILGFSAGGHLAAWTSTQFDKRAYEPIDATDQVDPRPDFTILVYPAYLTKPKSDELAAEIKPTAKTPPTFFAHANDDPISPENSARYYLALKRAGVPAELHIFTSGGHGFGMNPIGKPAAHWPDRCAEWMRDRGLLGMKGH